MIVENAIGARKPAIKNNQIVVLCGELREGRVAACGPDELQALVAATGNVIEHKPISPLAP